MSEENKVMRIEGKSSIDLILFDKIIKELFEEERKRKNIFYRLKKFFMKRFDF